jgi:hypothetical protein
MATLDVNSPDHRFGRMTLASVIAAWFTADAMGGFADGEKWGGIVFLVLAIVLLLTLLPMARTELRSRTGRWERRDTSIALIPLIGLLYLLAKGLLLGDSDAERTLDLAVAPVWILLAGAWVLARRHNVSRES